MGALEGARNELSSAAAPPGCGISSAPYQLRRAPAAASPAVAAPAATARVVVPPTAAALAAAARVVASPAAAASAAAMPAASGRKTARGPAREGWEEVQAIDVEVGDMLSVKFDKVFFEGEVLEKLYETGDDDQMTPDVQVAPPRLLPHPGALPHRSATHQPHVSPPSDSHGRWTSSSTTEICTRSCPSRENCVMLSYERRRRNTPTSCRSRRQ